MITFIYLCTSQYTNGQLCINNNFVYSCVLASILMFQHNLINKIIIIKNSYDYFDITINQVILKTIEFTGGYNDAKKCFLDKK